MSGTVQNRVYYSKRHPRGRFPEFESFHLTDFSTKAQLSKSVASTIPPRPQYIAPGQTQGHAEYYSTTNRGRLQPLP